MPGEQESHPVHDSFAVGRNQAIQHLISSIRVLRRLSETSLRHEKVDIFQLYEELQPAEDELQSLVNLYDDNFDNLFDADWNPDDEA